MRTTTFIVILVAVGLFVGCSSHRAVVVDPMQGARLGDFSRLEIPAFDTTLSGDLDPQLLTEIPLEASEKIRELGLYQEVSGNAATDEGVLRMEGTVISYEKGSRAKRYLIGMGSGKAYTTVQCTFKNKQTGQTLARVNFEGELSGGLFGGGSDGAAGGVVNAIVDYFKENR